MFLLFLDSKMPRSSISSRYKNKMKFIEIQNKVKFK